MVVGEVRGGQGTQVKKRLINVTELTCRQKRIIFADCFSEGGFVGFDKRRVDGQTYYVFIYKN
jgi:hypothetical protein